MAEIPDFLKNKVITVEITARTQEEIAADEERRAREQLGVEGATNVRRLDRRKGFIARLSVIKRVNDH